MMIILIAEMLATDLMSDTPFGVCMLRIFLFTMAPEFLKSGQNFLMDSESSQSAFSTNGCICLHY